MVADSLVIDWLGGNCPVQAEGTIAGKPFYFRARGQRWLFEVADRDLADIAWIAVWAHEEPYGDGPFSAGWMTEDEARAFIEKAAAIYEASAKQKQKLIGMVEKVARFLAAKDGVHPDWSATGMGMPGPEDNDPGWKLYEEDARSIIEMIDAALEDVE